MHRFALLLCLVTVACATPRAELDILFPPGGPPLNQHFTFEVTVDGADLVGVDAGMPAHNHGINTVPEILPLGDGHWQVSGMLLHMPGAWEMYFDLRDAAGRSHRVVRPLQLEHGG